MQLTTSSCSITVSSSGAASGANLTRGLYEPLVTGKTSYISRKFAVIVRGFIEYRQTGFAVPIWMMSEVVCPGDL